MTKAEEKAGEECPCRWAEFPCSECRAIAEAPEPPGDCPYGRVRCDDGSAPCDDHGTARQPAEPAASEGERKEPMQRRKTVAQARAEGLDVTPGRGPQVRVRSGPATHNETLESVRETYWADRAQELEALFQRTHNVHADWVRQAQKVGPLESALSASRARVGELTEELEQERVRLAGCGAAALGYADDCKPGDYGWSASLGDVQRLRKHDSAATAEVAKLRECLRSAELDGVRATAENERLRGVILATADELSDAREALQQPVILRLNDWYGEVIDSLRAASAAPREKDQKETP